MSGTIQASVVKDSASATNNLTLDTGGNATVGNTLVMGSSFLRNRIINGDMRINQRGYTSAAPLTTSGGYPVDRYQISAVTAGGFSSYQSSTAPTGFTNSLLFTKTTGTAPSAGDADYIVQPIEGYNTSDLAWGTANAKTVTLSFWVYAGATGTFSGSLRNGVATLYSYPFTYTISSANTWTQISVTVAGPTVGTWNTDNTAGVNVFFDLGSGTNFRGTAGAWSAGNYTGATGATTYPTSTTGGTFYVTGVQLEVGTVATPFERQIYSTQLAQCQRYAYKSIGGTGTYCYFSAFGQVDTTTSAQFVANFPVPMRSATALSLTTTGTAANYYLYTNGALRVLNAVPVIGNSSASGEASQVSTSVASAVLVAGNATQLLGVNASSAYLLWTSEL
jgi:hypothetical protein